MITKIKSLFLYLKKKIIWFFIGGTVVLAAPMAIPQEPIGEPGLAVYTNEDIQDKRNLNSKHFDNGDGSFTMNAHIGHIHFENESGELENVDCRFTPMAYGGWEMRTNNYELEIPAKVNGWFKFINSFSYDSRGKEKIDKPDEVVAFRPLGVMNVKGTHIEKPEWKGKGIVLYKDAYGQDIDLEVMARNTGFVKEIVINKKLSDLSKDLEFAFEIDMEMDIWAFDVKPKKANYMKLREAKVKALNKLEGKAREAEAEKWEDDLERETWDKAKVFETSDSLILGNLRKTWFRKFNLYDSEGNHGKIKVRLENIDGKIVLTKVLDKTFLENAVYPVRTDTTTSYYAGSGDGFVMKGTGSQQPSQATWDASHDASVGQWASTTYDYETVGNIIIDGVSDYVEIWRAYFPIPTSGLGSGAIISAATFKVKFGGRYDAYNDDGYDYIVVVKTFQASTSALATADYEDCGYDSGNETGGRAKYLAVKGSNDIDHGSVSVSTYTDFTLNTTGREWISLTGTTMLGIREGHDIQDNFPGDPGEVLNRSGTLGNFSEKTDTAEDPYLSVTYTTGINMKINIADSWKEAASMKINIGDVWKDVASMKINIGDAWKVVF